MAWLVREGEVLASLEVATSWRARRKGLLGRAGVEGALLLRPCTSVHTAGMRFDIDVAFCDEDLKVLETVRMRRWRIGRPRPGGARGRGGRLRALAPPARRPARGEGGQLRAHGSRQAGSPSHPSCRSGGPLPSLPPARLLFSGIGLRPMP
jgi:hypothetical protein